MIASGTSSPLAFFHPTRLAVLASELMLDELRGDGSSIGMVCEIFADPAVLARDVCEENLAYERLLSSLVQPGDAMGEDADGAFAYYPIESLIEKPSKRDVFSLVLLDFDVLGNSGLSAVGDIRDGIQERVLVVDERWINDALDALNGGLVDRLIPKNRFRGLMSSDRWIAEKNWAFHGRSQSVFQPLNRHVKALMIRRAIDRHMQRLLSLGKIREFYRDRATMSFLCLNDDSELLRTAFLSEAKFDQCALLSRSLGAPNHVVREIREQRGYIFDDDLSYRTPGTNEGWQRVVWPAESFESGATWKVVVTEDPVLEATTTY